MTPIICILVVGWRASCINRAYCGIKELECSERALLKQQISQQLAAFELAHTTIELEYPDEACRDH